MKLVKMLDNKDSNLISDPINQEILKALVAAEHSPSEIAKKLNLSTLKIWRRFQKLCKAKMIEQTKTKRVGNIEKKLYRATATLYTPNQYFSLSPKNPALQEAYIIYSDIQKAMMIKLSNFSDVPEGVDPGDFSLYASMKATVEVYQNPKFQSKIIELEQKLSGYHL